MTEGRDGEPRSPSTDDPIQAFAEALRDAEEAGLAEPNAMVVSSVDSDGQPSSRVVLLKSFGPDGFVFYTNLQSRKGREIVAHPKVALNFWWRELERQIVILGRAEKVSDEEADAYFASRPRASRLGAWASDQSRTLDSRARLVGRVAKLEARFLGGEIPRPPHWSGFRVRPHWIELWKSGAFRLHARKVYERSEDGGWTARLLHP